MTSAGSLSAAIGQAVVLMCCVLHVQCDGLWDQWSDYSPCSRSCGGGVKVRTRGCLHMGTGRGMGCVGPDKEYMSCQTESCPRGSEDFRSIQCSKFNQIPMTLNGHSNRYEWVPHFDEKNRCSLKCHALGTNIVRELEEKVTDGTQCDSPENFGVCVGGVCQNVGCDRMIGSVMKEDKCRVCGGDGSACRTEIGVFSQKNLNVGYHDILTIPEGSTSIAIREMKPSHSYLGMKNARGHFYINGGRDRTSQKAIAGTIFQYYSADDADVESILARGPTNESLIIMLISREGNPGIEYEYSIPQSLVEKASPTDRFTWVYGRWTSCSKDCGLGYQLRAVSCMDRETGGIVHERSCDIRTRPRGNQTCNMGTCAEDRTNGYSWVLGHWDECSVLCGVGEQTQLAYCQEKGTMGQTIFVSDDLCLRYLGEKPKYKRVCQGESGCPHWATGAWNECGVTCGYGYQTRRVYCRTLSESEVSTTVPDSKCKSKDRPKERKPCQLSTCPGRRGTRIRELEGRGTVVRVRCSETRHGCCPDGVTTAQGPNDYGCPLTRNTNQCKLDRSRGPCANYTLKWYYDDQTGMCNMFWYGGCGGNDNRFDTTEECEAKCADSDGTGGGPCSPGSSRCRNIQKCIPDSRLCDGFNDCGDNSDEEDCHTGGTTNQCGPGSSMCSSVKKCVSDAQRCDGYDDCGDNSDEEGCQTNTGRNNQCSPGASMCRSIRKCVADSFRCDGYDDCGDNSDEEDCTTPDNNSNKNPCGRGRSMCRSVRKCVPDSRRCDGRNDCGDNSDEENCQTDTGNKKNPCGRGRSMCRSVRKCVPDSRRCDGRNDCGDNSDEENCETDTGNKKNPCGRGRSMCRSVRKCVPDSRRCDGRNDCGDNSDEENCQTNTDNNNKNPCGRGRSMCRSVRKCVPDSRRCDGHNDCGDNSDEENCIPEGTHTNTCGVGSSFCRSVKKCVADSQRCDGINDCGDNSDEENCIDSLNKCQKGSTMCRSIKKCVSNYQLCDGNDDCGDNSDEENCGGKGNYGNQCGAGSSFCKTVKKCVPDSRRCDGYDDCGDNSDEENCDNNYGNQCGVGSSFCKTVKKCVPDSRRCDGYDDCGDNSDEENCDNNYGNKCGAGSSFCKTVKKCVPDSRRCDGYDDCGDNSDEENCDNNYGNKCGAGSSFCKTVKKCVPDSRRCDGYDDCGDNSDEENCDNNYGNKCGAGSSFCKTVKKCVPDSRRCDGYDDCGDNSDEENCDNNYGNKCGAGSSFCKTVKKCVPDSRRCDGYDDCGDNSDEENCDNIYGNQCGAGSSFCRSVKKCVADWKRCDGYDDCGDNSDEENCEDDNIVSIDCGTSTYGCCPDGQTSASGPSQEGCPSVISPGRRECRLSRYGCCPDGVTPASGPRHYGCHDGGCERSIYGCCPDRHTPASGPDHQGCPGKHGSFDTASCGLPKAKGDCGKWAAQWHFSTTMGTCTQFWYGGCGGNVNRFQNKTECEQNCVHVKGAGLCRLPMATGPCKANKPRYYFDYKSMECKKFTYGGCRGNSNRFRTKTECEMKCSDSTYIDSEDDEGPRRPAVSLCKSSRYGCCPDGRTTAVGPNDYGCPRSCQSSRYGCCDDGITPAEGPNMYGCDEGSAFEPCENSQYGCCSDGTTRATGYNQEGCDDQDVVISGPTSKANTGDVNLQKGSLDPCSMEKDSTLCKDYVVKWYWDRENQRCVRFWFGGCEGTMNKFDSEDDCLGRCKNMVEPAVNRCDLPKEVGPCRALIRRWYFDHYTQQCRTFNYGGCQGNNNNFLTETECRRNCGGRVATPAPTPAPPPTTTTENLGVRPEKSSIEMQGDHYVKEGRHIRIKCDAKSTSTASSRVIEWFKDGDRMDTSTTSSSRVGVIMSLSGYTMVSELTIQNAEKSDSGTYYCRSLPDGDVKMMTVTVVDVSYGITTVPPTTTYPPNFYTTQRPRLTQPRDVCMQAMESGPCYASIPKWYYDHNDGVCREFIYGGCEGNENNFDTKEECDTFCRPEEICILPHETGPCRAAIPRWAYDSVSNTCEQFTYGGCQGNPNNFETRESCERRCRSRRSVPSGSGTDVCRLPRAGGNCQGYNILWFYDSDIKRCRRFIYTGCGGNGNQFETEDDCESACQGSSRTGGVVPVSPKKPSTLAPPRGRALCDLRPDNARCDGNNDPSNYEIKWYYDYERGLCARFYFGGCGGNANRFDTRPECQSKCVYGRQVKTTPRPAPLTTPRPLDCRHSMHGCCKDGFTTADDEYHSNCDDGPNVIERRKGEDYEILVRPGRDVLINCRIARTDQDLVTWYRDRFTVKTNYRNVLYNNGSLLIKAMKPEDAGSYSCQVSGGNNVPQIERYNVQVRVPVRILHSPKIIKIRPNDNAFLHCQVYGQPTPSVTWLRNGRPISSTGHYRAFDNGTLIIMHAQDNDAGTYECHAENGVSNMAKKKVELRIRERVKAKLDPYKGKVIEGGTVVLRCTGSGYPRPTMHWERDGKELTNDNKISIVGRELVIRSATIEDSGIYTCVVKNSQDEARAVTIVQVVMQQMTETCEDSLPKMKCKMIRTARLCGHRMFSKMCCESCVSYRYR